ncbi:hypothetical protein SORBI_3001G448750 [Sorghum bicolor]|uniref:Uncharacterized protein n=1 Tax=Sorghum bicolor TaxID=4558 RepID=A0A1Z5SAM5_SORBI|nr:hypothetical protein SORBI_3001G448750 [Sorghum bicolor]
MRSRVPFQSQDHLPSSSSLGINGASRPCGVETWPVWIEEMFQFPMRVTRITFVSTRIGSLTERAGQRGCTERRQDRTKQASNQASEWNLVRDHPIPHLRNCLSIDVPFSGPTLNKPS